MAGFAPIRLLRLPTIALALLVAFSPLAEAKRTVAQKKKAARTQFETAERMREALNGTARDERTTREYVKVIEAYRRVYYIAPTSNRADDSVVAVAELLAERGRLFRNPKLSRDAIGQYEFLRREYPGSPHRVEAAFTIGKICQDDLHDNAGAKTAFEEFLKQYPQSSLVADAKQAIYEIEHPPSPFVEKSKTKKETKEAKTKTEEPVEPRPRRLPLVSGIRHWSTPDYTRVAIDLEREIEYEAGRIPSPDRIFFDLHETKLAPELAGKSFNVEDGFLRKIRVAQYQRGLTRVVLEVDPVSEYSAFLLPNPYRLIIDIHGKQPKTLTAKKQAEEESLSAASETTSASEPGAGKADGQGEKSAEVEEAAGGEAELKATPKPTTAPTVVAVAPRERPASDEKKPKASAKTRSSKSQKKGDASSNDVAARQARPTRNGEPSLIRALGLKIGRIVVDAGHGGHDTGTIGPRGLREKDLVLDVAMRLGKLLENRMGAEVVQTRDDDTFVPLETRTAVANQQQADLFISIHANSSRDPSARGVETYYLNFTSSADALEVAARENAVSENSIHELQDLVKKIALREKIEESREFAGEVQRAIHTGLAKGGSMPNRGVKQAPFIVLIGANMPSVLAEISFVSNPRDERRLKTPEHRQKIAESLYRGISRYVNGLSGLKVAARETRSSGQ
ncbi:MAG: N-acetylmuramoyl-L-alanine amidase [Acidobacteriales bacterium]|nr:N-acetylmuramoyl-L-alanine amidase [Terriglobales bacterium]